MLQTAFADERPHATSIRLRQLERNAEVITVLRGAIAEHRQRGGVLARVPTDDETLIAIFAATLGWGAGTALPRRPRVNEVKIVGRAFASRRPASRS